MRKLRAGIVARGPPAVKARPTEFLNRKFPLTGAFFVSFRAGVPFGLLSVPIPRTFFILALVLVCSLGFNVLPDSLHGNAPCGCHKIAS